jgi:hypothetical protein
LPPELEELRGLHFDFDGKEAVLRGFAGAGGDRWVVDFVGGATRIPVASTTCRYFVDQELGRRSRAARAQGLEAPAASVNEMIMAGRVVEMYWGGEGEAVRPGRVELERRPSESEEAFTGRREKLVRAAREAAAARLGPEAYREAVTSASLRADLVGRSLLVDESELDDHPVSSGERERREGAAVVAARTAAETGVGFDGVRGAVLAASQKTARYQGNGIANRESTRLARAVEADLPLGAEPGPGVDGVSRA